jgi:hypothetical protein
MPGLGPRLPIEKDPEDGFGLLKTYAELVKQNFKNLLLTAPGERMMDPDFGCGLRNFLFLNMVGDNVRTDIGATIGEQVARYMSFVQLDELLMEDVEDSHILNLTIEYSVPSIGIADRLSIQASLRNNEITAI